MQFESRAMLHESQSQTPTHDIEKDKPWPVCIDGASFVKNFIRDSCGVQHNHVLAHHIEVNDIGI
jgi:hypothetical protein